MEDVDVDAELLITLVRLGYGSTFCVSNAVFSFLNISNIGRASGPVCP